MQRIDKILSICTVAAFALTACCNNQKKNAKCEGEKTECVADKACCKEEAKCAKNEACDKQACSQEGAACCCKEECKCEPCCKK